MENLIIHRVILYRYNNTVENPFFHNIKKYFYNINHNKLKEIISKKIKDKDLLKIIDEIIDSTNYINDYGYDNIKGLPIGNMTSQNLQYVI